MDDDVYSITRNGRTLDRSKYSIDKVKKVFKTTVDNVVLNFTFCEGWTFETGRYCTFDTGANCTFHTGAFCTFNTCSGCTFDVGDCCVILTYDVTSCKFISYDGISVILDRYDKQRYVLDKDLINMLKVIHG